MGVYKEVIDSSVLTNKPIEYRHQVKCLEKKKGNLRLAPSDLDGEYYDITPFIQLFKPVKMFRDWLSEHGT